MLSSIKAMVLGLMLVVGCGGDAVLAPPAAPTCTNGDQCVGGDIHDGVTDPTFRYVFCPGRIDIGVCAWMVDGVPQVSAVICWTPGGITCVPDCGLLAKRCGE